MTYFSEIKIIVDNMKIENKSLNDIFYVVNTTTMDLETRKKISDYILFNNDIR